MPHETLPSTIYHVIYIPAKFEVDKSNGYGAAAFTKKIHYLTLNDLGVMVTRNSAQCPLHHMTYVPAKFEVATSKG